MQHIAGVCLMLKKEINYSQWTISNFLEERIFWETNFLQYWTNNKNKTQNFCDSVNSKNLIKLPSTAQEIFISKVFLFFLSGKYTKHMLWFKVFCKKLLIVKILSAFRSLFRNDFHYSGTIALLESKFHFQIEDWNLPTVDSFEITNVDWVVTYINQKFTREIRNRWRLLVSIGLTLQGIFLNFQEHFLCIYSRLVFKKLFFTVL